MRALKIIITTLLSLLLVLSLSLCICLGLSSSSLSLINKDSRDARVQLYYSATSQLENANTITIENIASFSETQISYDIITCSIDEESVSQQYNCSMISKLYTGENIDTGTLVRTSFFPGDGYKYSVESDTKIKSVYSNEQLVSYLSSLISRITDLSVGGFAYLICDYLDPATGLDFKYDNKLNFNFNTFSLNKEINATYTVDEESSYNYNYQFDKYDRITKLTRDDYNSQIEISYEKTTLSFPTSYDGYVLA